MKIIGTGQLAKIFQQLDYNDVVIFASGVSNSSCNNEKEFEREERLLKKVLLDNDNKKFVYFGSAALSVKEYPLNSYYQHKLKMENIIKEYSSNYYIFRIPQLFGVFKKHPTLINFLYESIKEEQSFKVYDNAYRYIIEINDVKKIVEYYLRYSDSNKVVNIGNPYRYKVIEIVNILEELLKKKGKYEIESKEDGYILDLTPLEEFLTMKNLDLGFGQEYFREKIKLLKEF